jgi:hypothetical protein
MSLGLYLVTKLSLALDATGRFTMASRGNALGSRSRARSG